MIVPPPAEVRSDASTLPLISHRGVVQRTIKKLTQDMHEFQLTVQLDGAVGQSLALNKGRHVFSGSGDGPEEVAIGDALCGSPGAEFRVPALDFAFGHVHQPIVQVLVDLAGAGLKLVRWDFVQIATAGRIPHFLAELTSKFFGVLLDQPHQSASQHSAPPYEWLCRGMHGDSLLPMKHYLNDSTNVN